MKIEISFEATIITQQNSEMYFSKKLITCCKQKYSFILIILSIINSRFKSELWYIAKMFALKQYEMSAEEKTMCTHRCNRHTHPHIVWVFQKILPTDHRNKLILPANSSLLGPHWEPCSSTMLIWVIFVSHTDTSPTSQPLDVLFQASPQSWHWSHSDLRGSHSNIK